MFRFINIGSACEMTGTMPNFDFRTVWLVYQTDFTTVGGKAQATVYAKCYSEAEAVRKAEELLRDSLAANVTAFYQEPRP